MKININFSDQWCLTSFVSLQMNIRKMQSLVDYGVMLIIY